MHAGIPPTHPPWDQAHRPPRPDRHPPDQADTPPPEADSSIRSTGGRYASYWNAFLLHVLLLSQCVCAALCYVTHTGAASSTQCHFLSVYVCRWGTAGGGGTPAIKYRDFHSKVKVIIKVHHVSPAKTE